MNIRQKLDRIEELNVEIPLWIKRIAAIRQALTSAVAPGMDVERVSHTRNVTVMQDSVAEVVDLEKTVDGLVDELVDLKNSVIPAINGLEDPREGLFVTERYLNGKSAAAVARENDYSPRHVHRVINSAIDHMDGKKVVT